MRRLGRVLPAQYWRGEAYQRPNSTIVIGMRRLAVRALIVLPWLLEGRIGIGLIQVIMSDLNLITYLDGGLKRRGFG